MTLLWYENIAFGLWLNLAWSFCSKLPIMSMLVLIDIIQFATANGFDNSHAAAIGVPLLGTTRGLGSWLT